MMLSVSKAVLPLAGFAVELLPATKAVPRDLMPVVMKPLVQYAVEEAIAAGITDIIFIAGHGTRSIEDHFDRSPRRMAMSSHDGGNRDADGESSTEQAWENASAPVRFSTMHHDDAGFGAALLRARDIIGNEPFAVLFPEVLIDAPVPAMKQLIDAYRKHQCPIIGVSGSDWTSQSAVRKDEQGGAQDVAGFSPALPPSQTTASLDTATTSAPSDVAPAGQRTRPLPALQDHSTAQQAALQGAGRFILSPAP